MAGTLIDVRNLTRVYRLGDVEVKALRGVSLTIERGEFVAIMGSSGSGKSTLMYILGCLDRPTTGDYFFAGVDVLGLDEPDVARIRSRNIGFVFQSFNLLARTNAIENVSLPLFYSETASTAPSARLSRTREALAYIGLGDRERSTPSQLSGGQQQRVAIARALINDPHVLLADEPTGNLDTRTSHDIMATIQRLNREHNVTVVLVTHEADIAAYADRIVTMRDGQIVSDQRNSAAPPAHLITDANAISTDIVETGAREAFAGPRPLLGWQFAAMTLAAATQALGRNKLRSALTMLGVFIGVAALIAMVAVGEGANEAVAKRIASLGTNLVVVVPGAVTAGGVRSGFGSASTLTVRDAEVIKREDSAVADVAYVTQQSGQVQYANRNWNTSIQGVSASYLPIANWRISAGRSLTDDDVAAGELVCLIGTTVYQQLFTPPENPVGATILVKSVPLRVVGLLDSMGQTGYGRDQDDVIFIPFTTAESKVLGVAAPSQAQSTTDTLFPAPTNPLGIQPRLSGYVNRIFVQAVSPGEVQTVIAQVKRTLAQRHNIQPGQPDDFSVRNLSQIAEAAQGSSQIMAVLLAAVASISLVVGGIGIMNILLVSVTERTREIGLRMAIGARRIHILLQFLVEAILLSVTGGTAGIVVGVAASMAITAFADWPTQLSPVAIVGGFIFSAAVGIFFGFYPARKAAHLDPIEALRYE